MIWQAATEAAAPRPAIRRDADGIEWRCYLDGSLDRISPTGRITRMWRADAGAWVDWEVAR